jgi:hypothetical protein
MVTRLWLAAALLALGAHPARAQDTPAPATPPSPLSATAPSSATTPSQVAEASADRARAHFQEGVSLSRAERWAEALAAFEQSAAIVERPSTLLNVATALQRLGRARECIAAVDRYLRATEITGDAEARARATALREAMVAALAQVSLAVLPADAQVSIDGRLEVLTADVPIELDPGRHAFVIEREGHLPARFQLELQPGQRVSRAVSLAERPAEPARLEVSTQVMGARIEIDGEVVGTDEVELELLPGPHIVRVAAAGWEPFERALRVEAGTRARIDAQLSRPGACQSVECEPAFWIVGGLVLAGAAAAAISLPFALASEQPPHGGTAGFHVDALRF